MTQLIVPIAIDDDILESTINEPDLSQDEEVWVDPKILTSFDKGYTELDQFIVLGSDGLMYTGSQGGDVMRVDTVNETSTVIYDNTSGYLFNCASSENINGNIYCLTYGFGDNYILKINVDAQTSEILPGTLDGRYSHIQQYTNGKLYAISYDVRVLIIDPSNDSYTEGAIVSSDGAGSQAIGADGVIYYSTSDSLSDDRGIGAYTIETGVKDVFAYDIGITTGYITGPDGNVYGTRDGKGIFKIDVDTQSFSTLIYDGDLISNLRRTDAAAVSEDDIIHWIGTASLGFGSVLTLDVTSDEIAVFGDYSDDLRGIALGADGVMYATGEGSDITVIPAGYDTGDQVILLDTHKLYQCIEYSKDSPDVAVDFIPPSWVEVSSTNKYRAFDYAINTKARVEDLDDAYTFELLQKASTISLFGLENCETVTVEVRENDENGAVLYSETKGLAINMPLEDTTANDVLLETKVLFDELPPFETPFISVSFTSITDYILVGSIVLGNGRSLGEDKYTLSTSRTNFNTVEVNDFGQETIVQRPSAEYTTYSISVKPIYANYVESILTDTLDVPCVFTSDQRVRLEGDLVGGSVFTLGYYERSPIVYTSPAEYNLTLKIRGLV